MKLRKEWMTDNEYFGDDYPNNILLEDAVTRFEIQRDYSLEGKDALVDGISERIVVQNHTNPLNQEKYDKKTHYNMNSLVHTGSDVKFDNKTWLVVSKIFDNLAYKTASVLESLNTFTFYKPNIFPSPIQIPYVVLDSIALTRMGIIENRYLSIPGSKMMLMVADNDINKNILRNDIYELYNNGNIQDNYKVIDINRLRKPGLIILEMEYCAEEQEHHDFTISIFNPSPLIITTLQTVQLNMSVFNNGELVSPIPPLIFTSSNDGICEVGENGLITPLEEGRATITVALANDNTISDSIDVTIQDVVVDLYTVDVFGENEVVLGDTEVVQAKVYNNGTDDNDKVIVWEVINNDGYVTIASQNARSITLQASSNMNYKNKTVTVRGKLFDNASVFDELTIQLVSLF